MNARFLYLAAQDAINNGQGALAISFLSGMVQKNPQDSTPRLQLAELLLHAQHPEKSLKHLDIILAGKPASSATDHREARPYLLQTKALILANKKEKAHQVISDLLKKHPNLLAARTLLLRLLVSEKRFKEAHTVINDGLSVEKTAKLLELQVDLFMLQGLPKKAEKSLLEIEKLDPKNDNNVLKRIQLALKQKNLQKAEKIARKFLKSNPNSMLILNTLGRLLVEAQRIDKAIEIYQNLVRDSGGNSEILSALGLLYYEQKDFENAARTFRKASIASPNGMSRFYLATSLEALQKIEDAQIEFEKVVPESPAYIDAQLRLVGIHVRNKDIKTAESRLLTIIKKRPHAMNAYVMLSSIRLSQKQYQQLLDETKPLLSANNLSPNLLFNRAIALEHFKRFVDLETTLKQLLDMDGNHVDALNFLGYTYADQGIKLDEAEVLILKALSQRPNDGYILDSMAWVYFKRGNYDKAIENQKKALIKTSDDPVMHEHMGDILWRKNQHKEAISSWGKSLQFKHEHPDKIRLKIEKGLP
ncbi:MAG: tetratricopeptide repeat protein [Mariprofundaceae bacterium]